MDSEELLAQLADIHLPEAVGFWPPAPGWWLLALLLLVATLLLVRLYAAQYRRRQICRHALAELEQCYRRYADSQGEDPGVLRRRYANEANAVLRRVALVHFPQTNVASLSGQAWVDFIRQNGDSSRLNEEIASALCYGRFQPRCDVDVDAMNALGRDWISSLYSGNQPPAEPQGTST